ncbi:MAG: hypothetical protein Q7W51_05000 [Coriobacteriia bacterium]|nr:hypothetical protein [Coriobacteriia bacterium]
MLQFAHIALGTGGGLTCTRCAPTPDAGYLPAAEVIARIQAVADGWTDGPGPNIVLGGPEPFAHPELPALVAVCVEAGVQRIMLETDGGALSVPANAGGVIRAGVRHLRVRLLDADEVRGDELSGLAGRTRDALAGVDTYRTAAEEVGARVLVTALVPVCEHNLESLPATVLALASHGFDGLRLVPGGELPASAIAVIAAACDTGMVNQLWVEADPALPLPPTHALHAVAEAVRRG